MGQEGSATVTRDAPVLQFRASFRPDTVNEEARTVEMVWSTGERVMRGFWDPFWEELSLDPKAVRMDRLNGGAPLLDAHDSYSTSSVFGVVERAAVDGKVGTAVVRFAKAADDPRADAVYRKVKDGILRNVSVGYRVHRLEEVETARSREDKIPVMRATDWEPVELSIVPVGADGGAGFRGAEHSPNPCVITRQEQAMDTQNTTTSQTAAAQAATAARVNAVEEAARAAEETRIREAGATAEAMARETAKAVAAERERETQIRACVRAAQLGASGDALADKFVQDGVSIDSARKAVFDIMTSRSDSIVTQNHLRVAMGEDVREKYVRGATASLLERAGYLDMVIEAKTHKRVGKYLRNASEDSSEFGGWPMTELARQALKLQGDSMASRLQGEELIKRALTFVRADQGFNTTSDFTVLLETAVNQIFLGRYATIPTTWASWCNRRPVEDFRTSTFYRPGTFGVLDSQLESGAIKHKQIPDGSKATITPATKANIVGITRRSLVNDRLSAFTDMAAALGEAAARTIEADAWAMLTANAGLGANAPDGIALFNAAHNNIGNTGVMSVATLDSMRAKMLLQKEPSGNAYLMTQPSILLTPVEVSGQAKVFNSSSADPTDNKNSNVYNRVLKLFDNIIGSPYLSASSATRHYALADPNTLPVFVVGFIANQEAPRLDSYQSFEYDGVQIRVIMDYGTAVIDYRGAVTCIGS